MIILSKLIHAFICWSSIKKKKGKGKVKKNVWWLTRKPIFSTTKENWKTDLTVEKRKKVMSDAAGSLRTAMAVIDTNICGWRRSEHPSPILLQRISLHHCNWKVSRSMWVQVHGLLSPCAITAHQHHHLLQNTALMASYTSPTSL